MLLLNLFMIGSYSLFLAGIVFISASLALKIFITAPSGADDVIRSGSNISLGRASLRTTFLVSVITLISGIAHAILHCSMITEIPLKDVFPILPAFLLNTRYGFYLLMRTVLVLAITLTCLSAVRKDNRWILFTCLVLSFSVLVSIAMSGHQGTGGYLNIPFFMDIIHIVAVSLWIGGLFFVRYCHSFLSGKSDASHWHIFLGVMNRFSRIAMVSVFTIITTGIIMYLSHSQGLSTLVSSTYGLVLSTKLIFVAILLVLGGINRFSLLPKLNEAADKDPSSMVSLKEQLQTSITTEVFFGLLVLLLTGILTHLSPDQ